MSSSPLVSILTPLYNREDLIAETLDSVLAQTYPNWECLVIDDHSTDEGPKVVEAYAARDPRIRLLRRPADRPKGANACRRYGLEMSRGEYICLLDSDDLFLPEKLEHQVRVLGEAPERTMASLTQAQLFHETSEKRDRYWRDIVYAEPLRTALISRKVTWSPASPMWKRASLESPPFNERLQAGQDHYFHVMQAMKFGDDQFVWDDRVTALVRADNPSITRTRGRKKRQRRQHEYTISRVELYRDLLRGYPEEHEALRLADRDIRNRIARMAVERNPHARPIIREYFAVHPGMSAFRRLRFMVLFRLIRFFRKGREFLVEWG